MNFMKGFEEKMSRIGRKFNEKMNSGADDAIEDLSGIMKKGDKVIDRLQKQEQTKKEKEIKQARKDERMKILKNIKRTKTFKSDNKSKPRPKKLKKKLKKKIKKKIKKIPIRKTPKIYNTKSIKPTKNIKQKMASLSPKSVKIVSQEPLMKIAKEVINESSKYKSKSKNNIYEKKKKSLIRNKVKQAQLAKRIKIGEFISIISNILILGCLGTFIYFKLSEIESKDSIVYWLSSKLLVLFIILIIVGSFLKFNGLWYQLTASISKWQSTLTFDFQIQFYLSLVFLGLLQIWTFIVNGEYDELFPTKTPIYLFAACLICMCAVNLGLSIANIRSRSGSLWVDFKDKFFKSMGLNFMISDSTKLNPMDEMLQQFDDDNDDKDYDNEDYDDEDDEDYDDED